MGDQTKCSSYTRLGLRRWPRPARGFRLSPTRISVRRLRARLSTLLGLLGRYVRNLRLLTRGRVAAGSSSPPAGATGGSRRFLVGGQKPSAVAGKGAHQVGGNGNGSKAPRRPPCMRSNSFYARAVAECLEFIKGSNVPPASPSPLAPHGTPRRGSRC
ncbi:hypothetical protein GQ55_4G254500 [Panicum hallii var. hallii]|jgi:hypothetical protein|uniref:Uncharacterized protein n=3 Tax=Panicum sect. Panicum TaxID=2100772 RepID=A0A3L6PDY6_PANMI|nr:uncharacterized protein LOC112890261 [Panicum hallii]PAN24648.1 hypothetical protein PAHAL_4G241600 [Panicum hallii]PUZ61185.1 hypothetical protein GQ55_4G254500 [Panicum hallii var. hallii]RLM54571.1 hypothetical protein C2845_PM10G09170 [Panicum miliaceum]